MDEKVLKTKLKATDQVIITLVPTKKINKLNKCEMHGRGKKGENSCSTLVNTDTKTIIRLKKDEE